MLFLTILLLAAILTFLVLRHYKNKDFYSFSNIEIGLSVYNPCDDENIAYLKQYIFEHLIIRRFNVKEVFFISEETIRLVFKKDFECTPDIFQTAFQMASGMRFVVLCLLCAETESENKTKIVVVKSIDEFKNKIKKYILLFKVLDLENRRVAGEGIIERLNYSKYIKDCTKDILQKIAEELVISIRIKESEKNQKEEIIVFSKQIDIEIPEID